MAEPIKIVITDDTGTQRIDANNGVSQKTDGLATKQSKENKKQSNVAAAGTFIAMRSVNYATANVGKYTGSKKRQTQINNATRLAGYGMALATNVWMGLAVIGVDAMTSIMDYNYERNIDQKRSQMALAKNGDLGGFRR